MATTQPIKNPEEIDQLKNYFLEKGSIRDYVLIVTGLNTSLRISDILHLRWMNVYHFKECRYRNHISLTEQKTGKRTTIALNRAILDALELYREYLNEISANQYLFKSRKGANHPISRQRAYTIIKEAVDDLGMEYNISCHSLRKTFGYQAWKNGVQPALLMSIYNHSSYEITKRYLCIDQDERDKVFLDMPL
ncbi:MAG: tyrosine-type recombinase/integrase [Lachnospiraceae bacterium]|nr:tyrosine-type recombinase/integrase [Lachnospiraceae bacterium]